MQREQPEENRRPLRREGREERDHADVETVRVAPPGDVEREADCQDDERRAQPRAADDSEGFLLGERSPGEERDAHRGHGGAAEGPVGEKPAKANCVCGP